MLSPPPVRVSFAAGFGAPAHLAHEPVLLHLHLQSACTSQVLLHPLGESGVYAIRSAHRHHWLPAASHALATGSSVVLALFAEEPYLYRYPRHSPRCRLVALAASLLPVAGTNCHQPSLFGLTVTPLPQRRRRETHSPGATPLSPFYL